MRLSLPLAMAEKARRCRAVRQAAGADRRDPPKCRLRFPGRRSTALGGRGFHRPEVALHDAGHSRRCAQLGADAARLLGCSEDVVAAVRRAALVHDFGTTGVPNSIWDKPGPLMRSEFDRVELHAMLTEQMLRRSPALAALNPIASVDRWATRQRFGVYNVLPPCKGRPVRDEVNP